MRIPRIVPHRICNSPLQEDNAAWIRVKTRKRLSLAPFDYILRLGA